ncbi:MAG: lysine--tRNA ligase, partial [Clostridia bacterium]|nr:lysine--tRNA ligase [Clostridia bacterium]
WELYNEMTEVEKKQIALLHEYLSGDGYSLDDLNAELYAIPKKTAGGELSDKELKGIQGQFFKNVYRLIIDKERGPRLYLFLFAVDKESYLRLLDFSFPMTEEESAPPVEEEVQASEEETVYGEPDEVKPIKEEIDIDEFSKIDLRVCKIVKVNEIRKSHNCLKLTLFDGLKERVIVSSIKHDYTIEELTGKKIIVVANLKSARLCGVTSQGMLLAGTNNACGCKVIFVDDSIPEGTPIC